MTPAPSASSMPTAADAFAGTWNCTNTETLNFDTPPGIPTQMRSGPGVLTVAALGPDQISSMEVAGGQTCHILYSISGTTATAMPNQMCMLTTGITLTYTMGASDLDPAGGKLSGKVYYNFSGPVSFGSGTPFMATGGGYNVSTCTRGSD
jgi:hypothetical protein